MAEMKTSLPILSVSKLKKYFRIGSGIFNRRKLELKAVDDISFEIQEGETFGLVGESGCGKSTVARTILRLYKPSAGQILLRQGEALVDITHLSGKELLPIRSSMQIIFQDPYSSLNPRMTVQRILREPLMAHKIGTSDEQDQRIEQMLKAVGLQPDQLKRYPHEFSGGQRQRIAIARALVLHPKLVVADEPVSALDVSIQAQVLNLLEDLQTEFGFSYLFVAHNLFVVRHISKTIAVMYLGRIVESGPVDSLFMDPRHPYTEALLSAIPLPNPDHKINRIILHGDVPSPIDLPSGCRFSKRCRYAKPSCNESEPELRDVGNGHQVACHFDDLISPSRTN
jgi:oligopeptide transport system ATP-binding protein